MIQPKDVSFNQKRYDSSKRDMIHTKEIWSYQKTYHSTKRDMIQPEEIWDNYDPTQRRIIQPKEIWFIQKRYDLTQRDMILPKDISFNKKWHDSTQRDMIQPKEIWSNPKRTENKNDYMSANLTLHVNILWKRGIFPSCRSNRQSDHACAITGSQASLERRILKWKKIDHTYKHFIFKS